MRVKRNKTEKVIIEPSKDVLLVTKIRATGNIRLKLTCDDKKEWKVTIANANQGYSNLTLSQPEAEVLAKELADMLRKI